jgi:hypothetical protein
MGTSEGKMYNNAFAAVKEYQIPQGRDATMMTATELIPSTAISGRIHGLGSLQFSRDASRRPTAIYRRYLGIAIGVYIDGEEVLNCPYSCLLGVAFREIGRTPGC